MSIPVSCFDSLDRKSSRKRLLVYLINCSIVFAPLLHNTASALPSGAGIIAGDIDIQSFANEQLINQYSDLGIINWDDFSISADELVKILQNSPDATLLNRVTSANPSELLGALQATGKVYVINPNGVLVGENAEINAAEFIASTLDVSDQDFLNGGDLQFLGSSDSAVINLGSITAENGDAILIAQIVDNQGEVTAPSGVAGLVAGQDVLFMPEGDQRIRVQRSLGTEIKTGAQNSGLVEAAQAELKAAGGDVYQLGINQQGVVRASGVETVAGRVLLTAESGTIQHSGDIAARNADGSGGDVRIGGDFQGQGDQLPTASYVSVSETGRIDVSAQADNQSAGEAIVWSDIQTDFAGRINGQAGSVAGDGAFVEVSGKKLLNYTGLTDLRSPQGRVGTLLLDPEKAVISDATDDQVNGVFNTTVLENNLASANMIIDASTYGDSSTGAKGDIEVNSALGWTSGNSLTLKAGSRILVNADVDAGTGTVNLLAGAYDSSNSTSINLASSATITASTLQTGQNPDAAPPGINLQPINSRRTGAVNLAGTLDVGTLDITTLGGGIQGNYDADNTGNRIGTLTTSSTSGNISGEIDIVDGFGELTVGGTLATDILGHISIVTPGDLTLSSGTGINAGYNGNIVLASQDGSFINNAGSSALTVQNNGRYLIYSDTPNNTTTGGLAGAPVYNTRHTTSAPSTITATGNRFLYGLQATATITADDLSRSAGLANPSFTYQVSGLVGSDTAAQAFTGTPSLSTTADTSSAAGTYNITVTQGSLQATDYNYDFQFVDGTLTVTADKVLVVTANNATRDFGDANPSFSSSFSGFQGSDDETLFDGFNISYATSAVPSSPVGTYNITPSGASTLSDYDVTYQSGTLTIDRRLVTIRADDASMTYLDTTPTLTSTISGLASFDDESVISGLQVAADTITGAGTFAIRPSSATASNYSFNYVNGELTVNPRDITLRVGNGNITYGEATPSFGLFYSNLNGYSSSVVDTSALVVNKPSSFADAGTYTITASGINDPDFNVTYESGTLTVNKADLTVTANDASRVYGDDNPAFSASVNGLVAGDTLTDALPGLSFSTTADKSSNVSTYDITPTANASGNYNVDFRNGRLTVNKATITSLTTVPAGRQYGDDNPGFTLQATGLKNGDSTSSAFNFAASTTATVTSPVGRYTVNIDSVNSVNYSIPSHVITQGSLTIAPRDLNVTVNDVVREYGDPNPEFSASVSGVAFFDSVDQVLGGFSFLAPEQFANAGTYTDAIVPSATSNANYNIVVEAGDMTITPAPVTLYAANSSRVYGDSVDPSIQLNQVQGLKRASDIGILDETIRSNATSSSDVGFYSLSATLGTPNYEVVSTEGTMYVVPAPITASLSPTTVAYGDDPSDQYNLSVNGLKAGDSANSIFDIGPITSTRLNVGTYDVLASLTSPNYRLQGTVDGRGMLNVTPRLIAADFVGEFRKEFGGPHPNYYTGITLSNSIVDPITSVFQINGLPSVEMPGRYQLSAELINSNYQLDPTVVGIQVASLTVGDIIIEAIDVDVDVTVKEETTVVLDNVDLYQDIEERLEQQNQNIEVIRADRYYGNADRWFTDFPELGFDQIRSYLDSLGPSERENSLILQMIVDENGLTGGEVTDAMIRDFMATLEMPEEPGEGASESELAAYAEQLERRGTAVGGLAPVLMGFSEDMQARLSNGEALSVGERRLFDAINRKFTENREAMVTDMANRAAAWQAEQEEIARNNPGATLNTLIGNDVPYTSFIDGAEADFLNERMAAYSAIGVAGGLLGGAAVAGGTAAVAVAVSNTVLVAMLGSQNIAIGGMSTAAINTALVSGAASGIAIGAAFAILVGTTRTIQVVQNAEQGELFNQIVSGDRSGALNFSEAPDPDLISSIIGNPVDEVAASLDRTASMLAIMDMLVEI